MKISAIILIAFVLFIILTPGILFYIPSKKSKLIATIVHGSIFAVILTFIISIALNQEGLDAYNIYNSPVISNNNSISNESESKEINNQLNYNLEEENNLSEEQNNQLSYNLEDQDNQLGNNLEEEEEEDKQFSNNLIEEEGDNEINLTQCMCPKPLDDQKYDNLKIDVSEYESQGNIKIKNKTYSAFNPSDPSVGCTDNDYYNNCSGRVCKCPKNTIIGKKGGTYKNYYNQCKYNFGGINNIDSCNT
jgi:membrane-associated HD superfamily phosphohydrolase